MIINPTKKTLPLFSALPRVINSNYAKAFLKITRFFQGVGISGKDIDNYFKLSEKIEVNAGFNRFVTSVNTMFVQMLEGRKWKFSSVVQKGAGKWLSETPIRSIQNHTPKETVKKAFQAPLVLLSTPDNQVEAKKREFVIRPTWEDFKKWEKYQDKEHPLGAYTRTSKEMTANNQLVLNDFEKYLREGLGLSDKVIRKHIENVDFFINVYLQDYGFHTPVTDFSDVLNFLSYFYPRKTLCDSKAVMKGAGASLKKFYTFLAAAKVITSEELAEIKEFISLGVEEGLYYI